MDDDSCPIPVTPPGSLRHLGWQELVAARGRKPPVSVCGTSGFLRRVGSDQGPEHFEKAFDGTARAQGLCGDAGTLAQQEKFVGEQLGIAQPGL
jgi:hypothetical protein